MRWNSAISGRAQYSDCLSHCVEALATDSDPTVAFLFLSEAFSSFYQEILRELKQHFPRTVILGCSASGLVGGGRETEFLPGMSLTAGWLPGTQVHPFHLAALPDLDGPPSAWRDLVGAGEEKIKGFILLADPFTFEAQTALSGLDYAYPEVAKLGGLASGCQQEGEAALFCGPNLYRDGCVGLAFSGEVEVQPVVAQGCDAIGEQWVITKCKGNVIVELGGKPAFRALVETMESLTPEQRLAAQRTLFVGLGAGKPALKYEAGDFLVRQVLGLDPRTGCLAVGATLRTGQTIQFHLRDARTSEKDLRSVLERSARESMGRPPQGALMFSCLGRGRSLYGEVGHDSKVLREVLGEVPLGGFFCNGEFGPVGGETALHGFTSSFALFSAPG